MPRRWSPSWTEPHPAQRRSCRLQSLLPLLGGRQSGKPLLIVAEDVEAGAGDLVVNKLRGGLKSRRSGAGLATAAKRCSKTWRSDRRSIRGSQDQLENVRSTCWAGQAHPEKEKRQSSTAPAKKNDIRAVAPRSASRSRERPRLTAALQERLAKLSRGCGDPRRQVRPGRVKKKGPGRRRHPCD